MKRKQLRWIIPVAAILVLLLVWLLGNGGRQKDLVIYGNVDLRQVALAFNNSERIVAVLAQEGDRVRAGQVVARLDTSRLEPQVSQAAAQAVAQRSALERLKNGSRPEEVAQAKATVEASRADMVNARQQYDRIHKLWESSKGTAVSQQDIDTAKAALDVADAKLAVNQKAYELTVLGPRQEDIAQAEAQWKGYEAQLAFLRQQLRDAELVAPADAVVRTRLMEPGELASPQKPVFSLAIIDPKWVRAYVSEVDLGRLQLGQSASVNVDSFPNRKFDGWVGFISPIAEFTPKAVQTADLRPSLVYEVRVFVKDPDDVLRLGMPATVHLPTGPGGVVPPRIATTLASGPMISPATQAATQPATLPAQAGVRP